MLPKPHLVTVTLLVPATKPDPYNPDTLIPDWTATPQETELQVSWLNQPARLEDDPVRSMVAWCAQIGVPGVIELRPGWRIQRTADETVWIITAVTPASSSPFTGWRPGTVADLELPVG